MHACRVHAHKVHVCSVHACKIYRRFQNSVADSRRVKNLLRFDLPQEYLHINMICCSLAQNFVVDLGGRDSYKFHLSLKSSQACEFSTPGVAPKAPNTSGALPTKLAAETNYSRDS
jgi:hypothetical protein